MVATLTPVQSPIRAEVFGIERLREHAESLAAAQPTAPPGSKGRRLLPRVRENGKVLLADYRNVIEAVRAKSQITQAEEWFLDNFHVVDAQIREIRDHLPSSFYRVLPKVASGYHLGGYPRVYGLVWAYVAHTDSRFDMETLQAFVRAYQRIQPLGIGEIWAVAIHLRVALVENLRRLSELTIRARQARARADEVADRLLGLGDRDPEPVDRILSQLGTAPLDSAFAVQLVQRLRDQPAAIMPALDWLNVNLTAQGTSPNEVVSQAHQDQAAANITVRNIITSMRWMSSIDWSEFFEGVSLVDEVLRTVPGFAAMDFDTRDKYRRQIEELSRRSTRSELEVTHEAVQLARDATEERTGTSSQSNPSIGLAVPHRPEEDTGYYLASSGRMAFEKRLGYRVPWRIRLRRAWRARAVLSYFGALGVFSSVVLAAPIWVTWKAGANTPILILMGVLALIPATDVAVAIVHRLITGLVSPRLLAKLDLSHGVPAELRTMVVVPTLLTSRADIEEYVERLQVHFLANPDGHLHFALLTDWKDAPNERMPGDEELLNELAGEIARLNEKHTDPPGGGDRFMVLHRKRLWNEKEGKWIGWERKRGKLHELNRLLRGATDTTFIPINGKPPTVPDGVRYVITLDADTRLPRTTAYRLVGAMAHPLNRPRFDPEQGRVVRGYGILQPRIVPSLPTGPDSTTYQRIVSGPGGVDPYAGAVSDVYQDLFGEGSYTGKGIYDVDAFEAALAGRVPDNALLSHDLFEGVFARAGLVTDIDLFEEFPTNYEVAVRRNHRWVRGDWQLLPWVLGRARNATGERQRAHIPAQGRWKMIDNLRRSLNAPSSFLLGVTAWTMPGVPPLLWTGVLLGSAVLPACMPVLDGLIPRREGFSKRSHIRGTGSDIRTAALQVLLAMTVLAHQAQYMTDAVVRTIARLYVTKRNLLEWVSAAQVEYGADLHLRAFFLHLRSSVFLALGTAVLITVFKPSAWLVAGPIVLLWTLSPVLTWRLSVPQKLAEEHRISEGDRRTLRLLGRKTWRFFEAFVTEEENFLPPDNFQEDPHPVVAHRTSPTNIGLYLLSTMSAHDFGWIGISDMAHRLETTLKTMTGLRRFHGHYANWYDTKDLRPLDPLYISTVDSGNLAGHLIALSRGCRELIERPVLDGHVLDGIRDTLQPILDIVQQSTFRSRSETVTTLQVRDALQKISAALEIVPTSINEWSIRFNELETTADTLLDIVKTLSTSSESEETSEIVAWATAVRAAVWSHGRDLPFIQPDDGEAFGTPATTLSHRLAAVALQAEQMAWSMDFRFLFDNTRKLFSIGFRVADNTLDPSCYDLLASEARLASFMAIAKGDVPPRHWFLLGRSLTPVGRGAALVSWSGSMFEYLMPLLVMEQPTHSLLDLTCHLVVGRQIRYGGERGVPWGVSESAYNVRDVELTYQYSDFGVPGLGLKRGLFEDVVVAPYATALAAMVDPKAGLSNIAALEKTGADGAYGFYEALDFTPSRLPEKAEVAIVRAYMAHHQGMTIVAMANVVFDGLQQKRFHADPMIQAAELLLQERTPRSVAVTRPRGEEVRVAAHVRDLILPTLRRFESPHDIPPRTHVLSNGRYVVMVTAAGSGFSRWHDLAVTRWREDTTRDCWGTFLFLRDTTSGEVWSAGFQPSGTEMDKYSVVYAEDRAKIVQRNRSLAMTLEILVSPEDDAELRQLSVTNLENRDRVIDITSYAEVVLAPQAADEAHPTFSKLFVETEYVPGLQTLLATRRPRAASEPQIWLAHLAAIEGNVAGTCEYETDRANFLGRGRGIRNPVSIIGGQPLSNTEGTVLDPIVSLRYRFVIPSGGTVRVVFTTLVAPSRDEALDIAEKYRQIETFERESSLAWMYAQVQLHHLQITQDEAHLFQRLANRMLYNDRTLRAVPEDLIANRQGASGLWAYGISGDLPIAVVRVEREEEREVARQLLRAHEYWRLKGISADLVIINAKGSSYAKDFQEFFESMVRATVVGQEEEGKPGKVFVLREDLLPPDDLILLRTAARVLVLANRGTLSEQVVRILRARPGPVSAPLRSTRANPERVPPPELNLAYFNGLGGFTQDGREYITILGEGQWTPAPWLNVIANPNFGFQVSESGSGYTWSVNSRENKLTPWSNDPVSDAPGEVFYVRDVESGEIWGPTCLPIREDTSPYIVRHGQGYSRFEHTSHGIELDLLQFVPAQDPIKISRLIIVNRSGRKRRLSITAYVEWVLGVTRSGAEPHVVTELDEATQAMLARNAWNGEFADRVAFADLGGEQTSWTNDRLEFLGRNATLDHPLSLERGGPLKPKTGATLDPCAALQTIVSLEPGQRTDILFLLGQADTAEHARNLVIQYRSEDVDALLRDVQERWDTILGTVEVKTPNVAMNLMINRWLLNQVLSCRVWSRSAFYQAGGAYGFRDQLQDVMALLHARPDIAREHILRAAARQFPEGDVQHWWHPPTGRGVRTRISDDRLWLPFVVVHYLTVTNDWTVLDELIPWLDGRALDAQEHEAYFEPKTADEHATLYEHCARALDCSLEMGSHGLPLIGGGDWNDGMNRVGQDGRGESVWLGWFLHTNLSEFAGIADQRDDKQRAALWRKTAAALATSLDKDAWDGEWYRRAFFDDGTPLGSEQNDECQIDAIAQSWAVLTGAGNDARARQGLESAERRLVRHEDRLLLLLTPAFDKTPHDPGYIKGYPAGIRENGGQYTHAAIWTVMAFAQLGDGDKSFDLFNLLNPIHQASRRATAYRYKVEPYVVAADIYSAPAHVGRGGWTWYTGAAAWLYRAGLESILGFRKFGTTIRIDPCIPREWDHFEIVYKYGKSVYRIDVRNPNRVCRGVSTVHVDGSPVAISGQVPLVDDGVEHLVEVVLGPTPQPAGQ